MTKRQGTERLTLKDAVELIVSRTGDDETVVRSRIDYHRKRVKKSGLLKMLPNGDIELRHLVAWACEQKGWEGKFSDLPRAVEISLPLRISMVECHDIRLPIRIFNRPPTDVEAAEMKIEEQRVRISDLERKVEELKPDALAWRNFRVKSRPRTKRGK